MGTPALTDFFARRKFRSVAAETPYADLLNRSGAFGGTAEAPDESRGHWNTNYENSISWEPRSITRVTRFPEPDRYVDGAARATLLAWGVDADGNFTAVVGGVVGAMAGRIENRRLVPEDPVTNDQHGQLVIGLAYAGFPDSEIRTITEDLARGGVKLQATRLEPPGPGGQIGGIERARVAAHSQITGAMSHLELLAIRGHEEAPRAFTIVDGNLGAHTTETARHTWPIAGVVKRHQITELPDKLALCALRLGVGQRTPAVLVTPPRSNNRPPMVSWYLKIRADHGSAMNGVIRVEVPEPYLSLAIAGGSATSWIDGLSSRLLEARASRAHYNREDCSLQPILLIEDRLHARAGSLEAIRTHLHRLLGLTLA